MSIMVYYVITWCRKKITTWKCVIFDAASMQTLSLKNIAIALIIYRHTEGKLQKSIVHSSHVPLTLLSCYLSVTHKGKTKRFKSLKFTCALTYSFEIVHVGGV